MLLPVQALLEDGPLQGTTVEVEAVEGRPPKTVEVPDDKAAFAAIAWQSGLRRA
jgi:hypothetical protein